MRLPSRLALFCACCASAFAANPAFDRFLDTFAADWVRADPQGATAVQFFTGAEQDALDRQLTPITPAYRTSRIETARRVRQQLADFDPKTLDAAQRVSLAMLSWQLDAIVADAPFDDTNFVFNQFMGGLQVRLVSFLTQTHPIRNRRDIENYLVRLEQVGPTIDVGVVEAKRRAEAGFIPPRFILTATIDQFGRFLAEPPTNNVLVSTLDERIGRVSGISATDRTAFVAAAQKTVADAIIPAFRRAQALLQEQLARSTDDAGIWRFPNGEAAYIQALHKLTTSQVSPAEIHALGLKEVARIEGEMDRILRQLGYATGSIKERMEKLNADSQPTAEPDPRPILLAKYESVLRDAETRAAQVFDLRPRAPVVVKREPAYTEKNAAAHYALPAKDGSRPGVFWAPLPGPKFEMLEMRTLVYHEAVPGHHFQIALQQENEGLPRFRRDAVLGILSAHAEGWALYAEQLAAELGWYADDPRGHLGQLGDELFRARRLVVDTGLHSMHWTRQQAIDYGIPVSEVERYVVWPGQACSYKVGQLKILALRARAKAALGEKFSLKEFHNVVLSTGSVPLDVLEGVIDDWIARARVD